MDTERLISGSNGGPYKWQINKIYLIGLGISLMALCIILSNLDAQAGKISIRMPDIRPDHAEQYLCLSHRVRKTEDGEFIVGFNPKSDSSRVHHMLVYGCESPGVMQRDSPNFVWDCSEMHASLQYDSTQRQGESRFEKGPVCKQGRLDILYGWALDAPALKLPKSVGFKIGSPDSGIDYLVLQVHYGHYEIFERLPDLTDNSGLILDVTPNTPDSGITRRAGILILASAGQVDQGLSRHELWCNIEDDIEVHPFRYRVHTHKLGTRVVGAKISSGRSREVINSVSYNIDKNSIIGSGNPQEPQMFYPVKDGDITLTQGDKVYAWCEFNNTKSKRIKIGNTGDDEMCNFYIMYWTNSSRLLTNSDCLSIEQPPIERKLLKGLIN